MTNFVVTKEFSRVWQLRCATKSAQHECKHMKQSAHRNARRGWKQSKKISRPATGWDVV